MNHLRFYDWSALTLLLVLHFTVFGPNIYTKTLCSLLFMYIGYNQWRQKKDGGIIPIFVFIALILAMIGDILLAIPNGFMPGGFSFLLCHVFYTLSFVVSFWKNVEKTRERLLSVMIPVVCALCLYLYGYYCVVLNIQDRSADILVIPYLYVISTMTALSSGGQSMMIPSHFLVFIKNLLKKTFTRQEPFSEMERTYLRVIGAVLFGISDIFVARQQFLDKSPTNALFGLPIYYIAQNFIAYSI
ncbi:hypothetical protein C9374_009889 [Naegleria lovaniensis]|uniref:YhhN-like protein n=1 Tax=Naegleria lovaniensis TaxID=51637 RepID=A0AA88GEW0_NAELO|nr:uncharacterized protein C9374_009889 [Naegleria lovaniensis]KAG2375266.1 hypothetical protein C9374_009889 [Naegleria lovaniensis]